LPLATQIYGWRRKYALTQNVLDVTQAWLPARKYVQEAVERRLELDQGGQIMKLPLACPWKEHLYELEEELALPKPIMFVIYEAMP
jgi:uncharacterized UPF0160 family protein